jgi:leader peptidase (prepilin peptidase)/N-methyltransferase
MLTPGPDALAAMALFAGLALWAALFDIRFMRIPDELNLAIFAGGVATSFAFGRVEPASALGAAALGGGGLLLLRLAFRAYRGYDGLGLGDVKFVAASAAWIGVEDLSFALLAGCTAALGYVAASELRGRAIGKKQRIPFGPFLATGALVVVALRTFAGAPVADMVAEWLSAIA